GSLVYQITREQISPYYGDHIVVPALREGSNTVLQPDVWYFDHPESQYTFTTITSLDASSGKEKDAQTYLLGTGNTLYVSEDAIYVSYPRYHPVIYKGMPQEVSPGLAVDAGGSAGISSSQVSAIPPDFNTLPEGERESILDSLRNAEQDAIQRQEADQTTTVIHKIGIRDGTISYLAKGEIPGTLDNQFSMDEYKDNLRVATTSSIYTPRFGQYTYNNVYVLDEKMATIGELTHIAEQETIYSTRFIGDRLYMVTFKRIDPFFVIDLAKPESPKILGKLKIPGYSDYLHPYDATHIIGIGKETTTNDWGGVSTSGVKLALFDVSDVTSPKQLDKVQIGDAGSDSAALTDHHAFLFDKGKNLLVIPIRAVSNAPVIKGDSYNYQPQIWYGAYVFGLTPESGFTLRGTVQHGTGDGGYYYYGSSAAEVKRSLYIGDILYTMSSKQIKANPLGDLNTTIATIPLPNFG
ncbi:MAG TPA: beta-propeller domain-containing protein, partial [Methanoculleus sp.]|nr:beta-propeller domain-containing protein [Methanoculleus sp.]